MTIQNRNDILTYCEEQLKTIFPAGVPQEATDRLMSEMQDHLSICREETVKQLTLFYKLSHAAKRAGTMIGVAGTAYNSIFVYLLDAAHEINPLPSHYYCENCGHYESGFELTAGIDLSEKQCPECGNDLRRDGFTLHPQFAWENSNSINFEYRIPPRFRSIADNVIHKHFRGWHVVMPLGENSGKNKSPNSVEEIGMAILPNTSEVEEGVVNGNTVLLPKDFPDLLGYLRNGKQCIRRDLSDISKEGIKYSLLVNSGILDCLNRLQEETGIFFEDISSEDCDYLTAQDVINTGLLTKEEAQTLAAHRPTAFASVAAYAASPHNSLLADDGSLVSGIDASRKIIASEYPTFTREDAYEFLLEWFRSDKSAYGVAEKMLMGGITEENVNEILRDCPTEFQKQAVKTTYLLPRAQAMWRTKQWLRLAWYLERYPQQYSEVIWK